MGRLDELGYNLHISGGKATVTDIDGEIMFTALRSGRLYRLEEKGASAKMSKSNDILLWHRRLGHLHFNAVQHLGKINILTNMLVDNQHNPCDVCVKGKMKRKSFTAGETTKSTKILEIIHSDVVGPIIPISKGGSRYVVTFIDDYSRYTKIYTMKKKSEVQEKFDEYRKMVENFHGTKVKILRSDNGGEYKNEKFNEYLAEHGIQRQLTVPDTPQQNGVAERMNQTLMDMTRCLLIESGIPNYLWGDAVHTACYIRNKCPSNAIEGNIPETLWTRKDIKLNHIKVYGCKAWMGTHKKRRKLDPKAEECIFIGYPDSIKGYKLWNPNTDKFYVSRDVTFDEKTFPCKEKENENKSNKIIRSSPNNFITILNDDQDETNSELLQPENEEETNNNENLLQNNCLNHIADQEPELLQQCNETKELKRSERLALKQKNLRCHVCNIVKPECSLTDPTTVEEALSSPDKEQWKLAMEEELDNLKRNDTWTLVPRPEKRRIVKCRWIFKKKFDAEGNLKRYKARLVARGYTQVAGIDYKDTYSPVVKTKSIRTLLALAVERGWQTHQLDITAAYLNGTLKETIYMEQPSAFEEEGKEDDVCLLKRSLYGLHQSGREWNVCLDEFLKSIGLIRSIADPCIYYNIRKDLIIGVYVDDILITANDENIIGKFKSEIKKRFDIKDLGQANHILNIRIKRHDDSSLTIDQSKYAKELLTTLGMDDLKEASTPLDPGMKFENSKEEVTRNEELNYKFRQAIGSLLYLAGGTRPDLSFATAYMSQFNDRPKDEHWAGVKHILRYVKKTTDFGLTFKKTGKIIEVFGDSDWASDKLDRKSFNGYVIMLAGSTISWSCKKQRTTALSTVEAEYLSMCHAAKEVLWLRNFLQEIGAEHFSSSPQILKVDNQGAITLAKNYITSERNKHIDLRHFFLREKDNTNQLKFEYVPTGQNIADMLTKIINARKMKEHCLTMGIKKLSRDEEFCRGEVLINAKSLHQ